MRKYTVQILTPLALSFALVLGACSGDGDAADSLAGDTAGLGRALDMAGRDTGTPNPNDRPAGGSSGTPRPSGGGTKATPTPPAKTAGGNTVQKGGGAGSERTGTVAAGTTLSLAASEKVCTNTHAVGSTFTATVANTVTGSNGVSIPAGSRVTLRVTEAKRSENVRDAATLKFAVVDVTVGGTKYPLTAETRTAAVATEQRSGKDAQKVAIGAAIGAIAGQVIGKDTKGTVIGAATGAAAGAAVAGATGNYDACLPSGGAITIALTQNATIGIAAQ